MLAMISCSKDAANPEGGSPNLPEEVQLSKASYKVGGGDQDRVNNFVYAGFGTRSTTGFEMPAMPTDEEINAHNPKELSSFDSAYSYFIVTGDYNDTWVNAPNQPSTLYVKGNFKGAFNGGNWTVYVLPGGSFEYIGENIPSSNAIYSYGKFTTRGNFSTNGGTVCLLGDTYINGVLTCPSGGRFYCDGTTYAKRININSGATVESCSFIVGDEDTDANYLKGNAPNFDWDATGVIEFEGGVNFHVSYLKAGYIKLNSNNNLHITLEDNGRIDTKYLQIDPKQNDQKFVTSGSTAVVCASEIYLNQAFQNDEEKLLPNFAVGVHLQDVVTIEEPAWPENIKYTPERYTIPSYGGINNPDFSMKGNLCSPGYGDQGPEPEPSLDLITQVKSPTHDHDSDKPEERHLSATSLTFDGNGNIYASYHMRGGNWANDKYDKDDIEGCIERWSFNGEQIEIGNWMWTNEFDFNHIILDVDKVITVGHKEDKGAIIGKMPTGVWEHNWNADDELSRDDFEYKYLTTEVPLNDKINPTLKVDYENAGDGNCVIKVGERYFVATSAGYGVIDSNFKRIKDDNGDVLFVSTPGSSKYLVEDNGQIYLMYLNDRAENGSQQNTKFGATLATMSVNQFPSTTPTTKSLGDVTPVDGKNVIAVDNGVVYACLSMGGLQIGGKIIPADDLHGAVNGVAVDDEFIYVANGNFISVLDKTTHKVVVERKGNTEKVSANFVEVHNIDGQKYIFVAFGQDGIKVYKYKPTGK